MLTLLHLLSGVAMLVWGTYIVRTCVMRVFGAELRRFLSHSIANRFAAFFAGGGVTVLVQSSNATAVLVASFGAHGLIALPTALAVMLGADVGTAVMARVLTLDLSWLAPLLTLCGTIVFLSRKESRSGQIGLALTGLGLILFALESIVGAVQPLTSGAGVTALFSSLTGDMLLDTLLGALFAMISYSSLAAVLLTATLSAGGVIPIDVALCLVVGANLGSGILAMITSSGQNAAGRRSVVGSLLFKLAGSLVVLPLIHYAPTWLIWPADDPAQAIVNFHVLYNVVRCVSMLALIGPASTLCLRLLPDGSGTQGTVQARYLDETALGAPSIALANAARETLRMGDLVGQMLQGMLDVLNTNDAARARETQRMDDDVDRLYSAVKLYLIRVPRNDFDDSHTRRWSDIMSLTMNLEQAGDIIERIIEDLEARKIANCYAFSNAGMQEIAELHRRLLGNLQLGLAVFLNADTNCARQLLSRKESFASLERAYAHSHLNRLARQSTLSVETSSLHLDVISDMRRLNSLFCSAAYPVLDAAGVLNRSRLREESAC